MKPDTFNRYSDSPSAPARQAYAIVPHDGNTIEPLPKALFVGTAGILTLRAADSSTDVTISVAAGTLLPIRASHVRAAGTTASDIVGLA